MGSLIATCILHILHQKLTVMYENVYRMCCLLYVHEFQMFRHVY